MTSVLLLLLIPLGAWAEDADIARFFSQAGVVGTMIIAPLQGDEAIVHDDLRSNRRYPAASTFKILNTLIALEEGIFSAGATFKWDGVAREVQDWNRDQTLESAFRVSCVWCFQQLAAKIGAGKYKQYLAAASYGELRVPFDETSFWLTDSLTISATEQIRFLKRIYRQSLPFKASSYETLREIMLVEQDQQHSLRAKTGWAARTDPRVGWYVGYVETTRGTWFFALNLDTRNPGDLPLRQKIAQDALRAKGIIH